MSTIDIDLIRNLCHSSKQQKTHPSELQGCSKSHMFMNSITLNMEAHQIYHRVSQSPTGW